MKLSSITSSLFRTFRLFLKSYTFPYLFISRLKFANNTGNLEPAIISNPEVIDTHTKIVIEGPESSANTFAVVAFKVFNPDVSVAHHLHAASQVKMAAKKKIPALILLRNPKDSVISHVVRHPPLNCRNAMFEYYKFFSSLSKIHSELVFASFEQIISDYGTVVKKINEKFSSTFNEFEHSKENESNILDIIETRYKAKYSSVKIAAKPSDQRDSQKQSVLNEYMSDKNKTLREKIELLYKSLRLYTEN